MIREKEKMIIPIRCFTCNKPIGHLWEPYLKKIQEKYNELDEQKKIEPLKFNYVTKKQVEEKTFEGKILDEFGLNKQCCRTCILSNVDLTDKI